MMLSVRYPRPLPCTLSASQIWLDVVPAGSRLDLTAHGPGAGAAIFSWSLAAVGDQLYSTLRRPMILVERDDTDHGIDLLRHDYWWPREKCLDALVEEARTNAIPAPFRRDWPYAANIFARTRISENGDLTDDPVATKEGARIELRAKFDVVVAVMAAGTVSPAIDILVDPTPSPDPL